MRGKSCPDVLGVAKKLEAWHGKVKGNLTAAVMRRWKELHKTVVAAKCQKITFGLPALPAPAKNPKKNVVAAAAAKVPKPLTTLPKRSQCELAGKHCISKA